MTPAIGTPGWRESAVGRQSAQMGPTPRPYHNKQACLTDWGYLQSLWELITTKDSINSNVAP
jgi:hypothetical protein